MKRQNFVFVQFIAFFLLVLISGCKKRDPQRTANPNHYGGN